MVQELRWNISLVSVFVLSVALEAMHVGSETGEVRLGFRNSPNLNIVVLIWRLNSIEPIMLIPVIEVILVDVKPQLFCGSSGDNHNN